MTLAESDIQIHFSRTPQNIRELVFEVREQILSYLPEHKESIRWDAIVFDKPGARATVKDNICYLRPRNSTLEIGFGLGVFLDDPYHLLQGSGRYKRQIVIKTISDYEHVAVQTLVMLSYHFDSNRVLYKLLPNDDYQALRKGI